MAWEGKLLFLSPGTACALAAYWFLPSAKSLRKSSQGSEIFFGGFLADVHIG